MLAGVRVFFFFFFYQCDDTKGVCVYVFFVSNSFFMVAGCGVFFVYKHNLVCVQHNLWAIPDNMSTWSL